MKMQVTFFFLVMRCFSNKKGIWFR